MRAGSQERPCPPSQWQKALWLAAFQSKPSISPECSFPARTLSKEQSLEYFVKAQVQYLLTT